MMKCVFLVLMVLSIASSQIFKGPPTVDELELELYDGLWYLVYTTPFVMATYQKNGVCGTATYKICDESTIGVYNHQRLKTPDGEEEAFGGTATLTGEPGKLKLNLDGVPREGDYWVMKLGPVRNYFVLNNDNVRVMREQYSYSLVSDPTRLNMFVIVRDMEQFKEEYEEEVLEFLKNNGFNRPYTKPVAFYQDSSCQYVSNNPPFPC